MNNIINEIPYLRDSREFPSEDSQQLSEELSKSYIDTALAMNSRTIGLHPTNRAAITGEKWYLTQNKQQQGLRRVYPFTSAASIDHTLSFAEISSFSKLHGVYTDDTNWFGLVPTSTTALAGQVGFYISPTQIVFTSGAGAPTPTKGIVILEWISFV